MVVAAVLYIYDPILEDLKNNILNLIEDLANVVLRFKSKFNLYFDELVETKIVRLVDVKNEFLAIPLITALDYCMYIGFTHLLTMDDDIEWCDLKSFHLNLSNSRLDDAFIDSFFLKIKTKRK